MPDLRVHHLTLQDGKVRLCHQPFQKARLRLARGIDTDFNRGHPTIEKAKRRLSRVGRVRHIDVCGQITGADKGLRRVQGAATDRQGRRHAQFLDQVPGECR
ncbi:MAG: hypothetical protein D6800_00300 [Candidatus Zixiibacteriota bacterium]|nr:MAG: hypothetical protein D6800_00300 [candidate division Zixibacteria bacterium]